MSSMVTGRVLIAEDHMIVRSGLRMLFETHFNHFSVEEVDNTEDLMTRIRTTEYEFLLLDIHLRDASSISLFSLIATLRPKLKILVFTMLPEEIYGKRLMEMGAHGFLSKKCSNQDIVTAISAILEGRLFMSSVLKDQIASATIKNKPLNRFEALSNREFEIMHLLLDGKSAKHIAGELSLQVSTVGTYKTRLLEKLEVDNIIDLNKLALLNHII